MRHVTGRKKIAQASRPAPKPKVSPARGVNDSRAIQRALAKPLNARPADLLFLQQTCGNQAVQRLLSNAAAPPPNSLPEGGSLHPNLNKAFQRQRGGGQKLDSPTSGAWGHSLGSDLSQVRVHTDAKADTLARSLDAEALTLGQDIFFTQGRYQPATAEGQHLLAHELTHVVQQSGQPSASQSNLKVGPANDSYEREAERVAEQLTASSAARPRTPGAGWAAAGAVQRRTLSQSHTPAPMLQLKRGRGRRRGRGRQQPQTQQPATTPPSGAQQPQSIFFRIWNAFTTFTAALANSIKVKGAGDMATRLFGQLPFKYEVAADSFSGELGPISSFPLIPAIANIGLGLSAKGKLKEDEPPTVTERLKKTASDTATETATSGGDSVLGGLWNWFRGSSETEATEETPAQPKSAEAEFSPVGFAKELREGATGQGGFKFGKGGQKVELEGSGSAELDLVFGKVTAAVEKFKSALNWAHEQLQQLLTGGGWLSWAASWVEWAASYVPDWVPGKSAVSGAALTKWIEDMLKGLDEFTKGLKPKAALTLSGEGDYEGYGAMANLKAAIALDVAAFGDEIRGKLASVAKFFGYEGVASGIEHLAGKATLLEFEIPSVSPAQGLQGLKPKNFKAGPVFGMLASLVKAPFTFVKRLIAGP